jgi:hypothetical protein
MIELTFIGLTLLLAGVGPIIFPLAQSGHGTMPDLALRVLLPAIATLAVVTVVARRRRGWLARDILSGAAAGMVATLALEAVRLPGFHLGFMPGNLPRLMGVLLLDRFALGPSLVSDVAGFAYHFWNGASFGITYVLVFGTRHRRLGALFGVLVGFGFLVSPVVRSLGVGAFGLQFSVGFPVTVTLAHLAFGLALGIVARWLAGSHPGRLRTALTASPRGRSAAEPATTTD